MKPAQQSLSSPIGHVTPQTVPTHYWMVKQEPEAYPWRQFLKDGNTSWTGVRNYQARNNLRDMRRGDLVCFYHSVSEKSVVGVARVEKEAYPDPTAKEGDWIAVDLVPAFSLVRPVSLADIKADSVLVSMALVRQSRLSVLPVALDQFRRLLLLAQTEVPSP